MQPLDASYFLEKLLARVSSGRLLQHFWRTGLGGNQPGASLLFVIRTAVAVSRRARLAAASWGNPKTLLVIAGSLIREMAPRRSPGLRETSIIIVGWRALSSSTISRLIEVISAASKGCWYPSCALIAAHAGPIPAA